jgi:hypothetical protein
MGCTHLVESTNLLSIRIIRIVACGSRLTCKPTIRIKRPSPLANGHAAAQGLTRHHPQGDAKLATPHPKTPNTKNVERRLKTWFQSSSKQPIFPADMYCGSQRLAINLGQADIASRSPFGRRCLVTQNGGVRSHDPPVLSGNFHADGRRWLDLFIDEQINAMKNDPLDDSSVGVALRLRLKLEKCLDRLLADIMEAQFRWAIEPKLVN